MYLISLIYRINFVKTITNNIFEILMILWKKEFNLVLVIKYSCISIKGDGSRTLIKCLIWLNLSRYQTVFESGLVRLHDLSETFMQDSRYMSVSTLTYLERENVCILSDWPLVRRFKYNIPIIKIFAIQLLPI